MTSAQVVVNVLSAARDVALVLSTIGALLILGAVIALLAASVIRFVVGLAVCELVDEPDKPKRKRELVQLGDDGELVCVGEGFQPGDWTFTHTRGDET